MIMSDVEMPSVLCVGTNIPDWERKRRQEDKSKATLTDPFP